MERTLAIIKPDAFDRVDEVMEDIQSCGFSVAEQKDCHLSAEQCGDFYIEHYGKPFYEGLKEYLSSGQCRVLVLKRTRAISMWRQLIGPTDMLQAQDLDPDCLRAKYGTSQFQNGLHGSDSYVSAEREIHFFFPDLETPSVGEEVREYLATEVNPVLLPALTEMARNKPENPLLWLGEHLKTWFPANSQTFNR